MQRLGLPASSGLWHWVEFAENVLIIAPVTFFASLLPPALLMVGMDGLGFLTAVFVEVFQGLFLPGRSATFSDVVANTLGALLGALVARALSRPHR